MQYELVESMCEFAVTIQNLVKDGWELTMEYGERRLGVSCRLILKKGDKEITASGINELEDLKNVGYREWEEKQDWYKK